MSDQVLLSVPQVQTAPLDYPVPNAQEIALQTATATFDGTGAASSFLPALQIIGPGGIVAGTFVNPNSPVAAGGEAEVTFGSFLGSAVGQQAYTTVQDEGTALPQESILDFVGAGVTAADDPTNKRTTVTIPGGGGGSGTWPGHSGLVSGYWYTAPFAWLGSHGQPVTGSLYVHPYWCPGTVAFKAIGINVSSLTGTPTFELGIYSDTGTGYPAAPVYDSGTLGTSATGIFQQAISVTLSAGLYWLAYLQISGAINVYGINNSFQGPFAGSSDPTRLFVVNAGSVYSLAGISPPLPSPFPSGAGFTASTQFPLPILQAA